MTAPAHKADEGEHKPAYSTSSGIPARLKCEDIDEKEIFVHSTDRPYNVILKRGRWVSRLAWWLGLLLFAPSVLLCFHGAGAEYLKEITSIWPLYPSWVADNLRDGFVLLMLDGIGLLSWIVCIVINIRLLANEAPMRKRSYVCIVLSIGVFVVSVPFAIVALFSLVITSIF